jgi:HAD superfamily hydrolase (TIGR01493 family)
MVAAAQGAELDEDPVERITGQMRRLPPHPDAEPALTRLGDAGFTLAALTNSTLEVALAQLDHAGLADRFDAILSADQVRALKPRPEPYRLVADTYGVEPSGVRLIAAHAWDVAGALAAGCAAAFVRRPGKADRRGRRRTRVRAPPRAPSGRLEGTLTEGERWTREQLHALLARRFTPAAAGRFLLDSWRRSASVRHERRRTPRCK